MNLQTNNFGSKHHPIRNFWRFTMLLAFTLFLLGLVFFIILPDSNLSFYQLGSFGGYVSTLLLFWIGDIGVLVTSKQILDRRDIPSLRKIGRTYLILDWFVIAAQAFILNALVWYVFKNLEYFNIWGLLLAGLNMVWLGVKIKQYDAAFEAVRNEYEILKRLPEESQFPQLEGQLEQNEKLAKNLKKTQYTMLNWLIINGVYSILISVLIQLDQLDLCVYLTLLRSIADFIICRQYYLDVLTGEL